MIIGISSALNLKMVGVEAPSGSVDLTISNLSRTSFVASSISTPYSNSRAMMLMFSFDLEVRFLRSLTPLREFSSTFVRFVSISSALAPGYAVITIMVLASKSGKLLMDRFISENIPNMAKATNTRTVVTGLSTAFLYMLIIIL